MKMDDYQIQRQRFADINLGQTFFDSLKADYPGFEKWFEKKAGEPAYIIEDEQGKLQAFLYLKIEEGPVTDVTPNLPPKRRVKVGTFKIDAHGTRLGERFIKRCLDYALANDADELYVTAFAKQEPLIGLFRRYGFREVAEKAGPGGAEKVFLKSLQETVGDPLLDYPLMHTASARKYLLSIHPKFHTRLLPDSILNNESFDVLEDVSHTNSIHKVYICYMNLAPLRAKDILVIYRTSDQPGRAWYRSVATSVCVVEEVKNRSSFASVDDYVKYCRSYSVFNETELRQWWNRGGRLYVIRFTYNAALTRRLNRARLVQEVGISDSAYWGFLPLTDKQFSSILTLGQVNDRIAVDQTRVRRQDL